MRNPRRFPIRRAIVCAVIGLLTAASLPSAVFETIAWRVEASPGAGLRIVDAADVTKTTPVVNEGGRLQLKVVDGSGNQVAVTSWSTDNKSVGKVNRKRGVLKGKAFGFASITAQTTQGSVSGFIVVARVRTQTGAMTQGDTKTDTGGNVYLSSPTRHVLYRASGLSAEVVAGHVDQSGYADGTGDGIRFNGPSGIGVDNRAEGGLYIADTMNDCIRKVDFRERSSLAAGVPGFAGTMHGDENPIAEAVFDNPRGVASVGSNLYVTDTNNNCIWYVDVQRQVVELVAGEPGETGNANGQGRQARFDHPSGITINSRQNLLAVADTGNNVIKLIAIAPRPGVTNGVIGNVTTLGLSSSSRNADILEQLEKDRGTDAIEFDQPVSVSFDGVDNVYVIDNQTASVVTRPSASSGRPVERVDLAQVGTLGDPASVTVRRTQAFVLNQSPLQGESDAINVVEVGAPTITNVTPDSGPLEGEVDVTVTGTNFAPESKLTLGEAEVTNYTVISSTQIVYRTPALRIPGARTLTVSTRGGSDQTVFNVHSKTLDEIAPGDITTFAGGLPYLGDGGRSDDPGVVLGGADVSVQDGTGNIYLADYTFNRVRRIDANTGILSTIAGNGAFESNGDGGLATAAGILAPRGLAVDDIGNVYVTDDDTFVRRVDAVTGIISTVAGTRDYHLPTEDGHPAVGTYMTPRGLAIALNGDLLILDGNSRLRRVDSRTGIVETIAGTGEFGSSGDGGPAAEAQINAARVFQASNGDVYVNEPFKLRKIDHTSGTITTVVGSGLDGSSGDGGPATQARLGVYGVAFTTNGDIVVGDARGSRIRRIDAATQTISTIGGTGEAGFSGDGGAALNARFNYPYVMSVEADDSVIIRDDLNARFRRIDHTGRVSTIAGSGLGQPAFRENGLATSQYLRPNGVTLDPNGRITICDGANSRILSVGDDGRVVTLAGKGGDNYSGEAVPARKAQLYPYRAIFDDRGNCYVIDIRAHRVLRIDKTTGVLSNFAGNSSPGSAGGYGGDGGRAVAATLSYPADVAVSAGGDVYIADTGNNRIRRVDSAGIISTIAGTGVPGFTGDGGLATEAQVEHPRAVLLDGAGGLLISDSVRIRRIDLATGVIDTIAGSGADPGASTGHGGQARDADLLPSAMVLDGAGNLFLVDGGTIRRIDAETGIIRTVAGGGATYTGDGGPATSAQFIARGIAVDRSGNIYIADAFHGNVRVVKGIAVPVAR